jgi:uncharacterized membrane protein YraQ (UPF0718 family)
MRPQAGRRGGVRQHELIRQSFGTSFWVFALLAVIMAALCYVVLGPAAFVDALAADGAQLLELLPRLGAAQLIAALVWVLVPRDRLLGLLGGPGSRGLVIAMAAGIITPGGPVSAFPLLAILASTGVDRGVLVAYITSWALLGMQRIVVWDMPLMGTEFSVLRFVISLPLPLLAAVIARKLPIAVTEPGDRSERRGAAS